jgi:hypothetical protein
LCRGFAQRVSVRRWLRRAAALRFCATPSLSRRSFASRYAALCAALMRRTVLLRFSVALSRRACSIALWRHAVASRSPSRFPSRFSIAWLRRFVAPRFCLTLSRRVALLRRASAPR